ncbi:MAG: N(2)-acetyl-L-2,4-diaminobutanoate deacetylase DoeB [Chloroflexi bacterium OHK40]
MLSVQTVHYHDSIDFNRPGKHLYELAFHYDGEWGNALVPMAVINGQAGPGPGLVAFGGTHGDEYEGQLAVWRLMHELDPAELCGRVILMPRLNTPACVAGTRESPRDGANMNRAFPGNPRGSLTARIAHFVTTAVLPRVEVVLDIHAAGRGGQQFALCSSFHEVPNPTQRAEMVQVASLFDTPFVLIYSSEMASGLLTDQAEAMGKITIGGEFGHSGGVLRQGLAHAYQGIKNVLRHYGMLAGPIERVDPHRGHPPRLVAATSLEDYLPAPISGYFEPIHEVGAAVGSGELVGRLYDFAYIGAPPLEVRSPRDGYILLQPFAAPTSKGDTMLVIAREVGP